MPSNNTENNYYKWTPSKGDYKRDEESTHSYVKKRKIKRRLRISAMILLYLSAVAALSYLIFGKF